MASLGELLVTEGLCTPQQVEDAVRNQVILGGRLGTNLVEMRVLTEEALAGALARLHALPTVSGTDVQPEPQALALLNRAQVDRLNVIPFIKESKRLQVLCLDPGNLQVLDEVRFLTGLRPDPIVVPEIRFWQLLRRLYGIRRGMRSLSLDTRDYLAASLGEGAAPRPLSIQEDLISEDSFVRLYHRRDGFPEARAPVLPSESMPLLEPDDLEELAEEAPEPPGQLERRVWQMPGGEYNRRAEDRALAERASALPSQPPPPPEELEPITRPEAERLLAKATDRSAVARIALRHARAFFRRAVLLTIHRELAVGWDGLGGGIDPLTLRDLALPLSEPSVIQLVVSSRAHFLGGLSRTRANIEFLRVLGRQVPLSAFALPVLVRGRVVHVLYCDNGHKAHCPSEVGDLLILAGRISQSYEELFQQRREAYLAHRPAGEQREVSDGGAS